MIKFKSILNETKKLLSKKTSSKLPREIGVVLLSTRESAKLNNIYRNKNEATNVLSFYYGPEYGEILICPEIVKKEAALQRNTQEFQMTLMIVHGMIHLAGIHHENSATINKRFVKLEQQILRTLVT